MRRDEESIRTWSLKEESVLTNVGMQVVDLDCELVKYTFKNQQHTLFERLILGYKNYFYRVHVTPHVPIRQNKDKEYLEPQSEEGNSGIESFSLGLGHVRKGNALDLSNENLNGEIREHLKELDPVYRREKYKNFRAEENKKWTNKSLFRKNWNSYHEELGIFTAIYPFHGHDLSGCTDILSLSIFHDDEQGIGFNIALLGLHLYFFSSTLGRFLEKKCIRTRPKREKGDDWNEFYYKKLKPWKKSAPLIERLWDVDWRVEIGISRYYGFFFRREWDGGSRGTQSFNPWRNKLWNLI